MVDGVSVKLSSKDRLDGPVLVARHELLWLDPAAWQHVLADSLVEDDTPVVLAQWADNQWPVIARRRLIDDPEGAVSIGVPLPPSLNKRRISLHVPWTAIIGRQRFVPLAAALNDAPVHWRALLEAVIRLGDEFNTSPALFGSLLWQHLTGLRYLSDSSDIDLLWQMDNLRDIELFLQRLRQLEERIRGPRLDGELVDAQGMGVNWREVLLAMEGRDSQVLVKSLDRVQLVSLTALLEGHRNELS